MSSSRIKWLSGRSLRCWLATPKRAFFPRARRSPVSASSRCSSKRSSESSDAPKQPLAAALGRLLYLVHLAVLLWWLLDKSSNQRATAALVSLRSNSCLLRRWRFVFRPFEGL